MAIYETQSGNTPIPAQRWLVAGPRETEVLQKILDDLSVDLGKEDAVVSRRPSRDAFP